MLHFLLGKFIYISISSIIQKSLRCSYRDAAVTMATSDDMTTWVMESSGRGSKDVWKNGQIAGASSLAWRSLEKKLTMKQLRQSLFLMLS